MTTVSRAVSLQIRASDDTEQSAEQIDQLTRQFRQEVLALDVDTVTVPTVDDAPAGAKGDPVTIGTLVVTLASSRVLVSLCQLARTWVTRDHNRRITLKQGARTLEITGTNTAQHQQLIDAFLNETPQRDPTRHHSPILLRHPTPTQSRRLPISGTQQIMPRAPATIHAPKLRYSNEPAVIRRSGCSPIWFGPVVPVRCCAGNDPTGTQVIVALR
jgi:hypothetical protein